MFSSQGCSMALALLMIICRSGIRAGVRERCMVAVMATWQACAAVYTLLLASGALVKARYYGLTCCECIAAGMWNCHLVCVSAGSIS